MGIPLRPKDETAGNGGENTRPPTIGAIDYPDRSPSGAAQETNRAHQAWKAEASPPAGAVASDFCAHGWRLHWLPFGRLRQCHARRGDRHKGR